MQILSRCINLHIIGGVTGIILPALFFKQHLLHRANQILPELTAHLLCHRNGRPAPGFLGGIAVLARHLVRRGSGAAGIGENVHIRKAAFLNKRKALGKFLLRLPRKCHNHIRGNGAVRKILIQKAHAFIVAGGVIFALHPLQNRVAAALHAQMELMAQIGQRRQPSAELLVDNSGLQRTQAHPELGYRLADGFNQPCHLGLTRQIRSPAGNFNACHHNFPVPPPGQVLGLLHCQFHRS